MEHDAKCPASPSPSPRGVCDCGADQPAKSSLGRKMDGFGNGCAVTLGRVVGSLTGWAIFIFLFRHDIAHAAAWFTQHVRIMP